MKTGLRSKYHNDYWNVICSDLNALSEQLNGILLNVKNELLSFSFSKMLVKNRVSLSDRVLLLSSQHNDSEDII